MAKKDAKFKNYLNEVMDTLKGVSSLEDGVLTEKQAEKVKAGLTSYIFDSSKMHFKQLPSIFVKNAEGNYDLADDVTIDRVLGMAKEFIGKDYGKIVKNEFSNYVDAHWDELVKHSTGLAYNLLLSPLEEYGKENSVDLASIANEVMGKGGAEYNDLRSTLEEIANGIEKNTGLSDALYEKAADDYVSKFEIDSEDKEEDEALIKYMKDDIMSHKNTDSSKEWLKKSYETKMIDCIKVNNGSVKEYAKAIPAKAYETNGKSRYDNLKSTTELYSNLNGLYQRLLEKAGA